MLNLSAQLSNFVPECEFALSLKMMLIRCMYFRNRLLNTACPTSSACHRQPRLYPEISIFYIMCEMYARESAESLAFIFAFV